MSNIQYEQFNLSEVITLRGYQLLVSCVDLGDSFWYKSGRYELMVFSKIDNDIFGGDEILCERFKTQEEAARYFFSVVDNAPDMLDIDIVRETYDKHIDNLINKLNAKRIIK